MNVKNTKNTAYLITDKISRRYFSGVEIDEGYLLFGGVKAYLTDARYFEASKDLLSDSQYKPMLYTGLEDVKRLLKENKIKRLGIEFQRTYLSDYIALKKLGVKIFDCSDKVNALRQSKTDEELEKIKTACRITQNAYYTAISKLKVGMTEVALKKEIEKEFIKQGAEGVAFETIVAFSKNSSVPHHVSDNTKLKKDSVVLVDCGAKYQGYSADLTRTCFFGTPKEDFINSYEAVLEANELALSNVYVGMTGRQADEVARSYLEQKGYGENFTHSLGHGVGLEIHESPSLSKKGNVKLTEGTVFTIEPGVYFEGEYGIRIEDTVAIINGKTERLFTDVKDLSLIN